MNIELSHNPLHLAIAALRQRILELFYNMLGCRIVHIKHLGALYNPDTTLVQDYELPSLLGFDLLVSSLLPTTLGLLVVRGLLLLAAI